MKRTTRITPEKIRNIEKEENGPSLKSAISDMTPIFREADITVCPYCGKKDWIRYGKKRGKQRFLCKGCRRTFITTTNTVMSMSHYDSHIWNEVLDDTLCGSSMSATEKRLGLSHQAVFHMRHKLMAFANDLPGDRVKHPSEIKESSDRVASSADVSLSRKGPSAIPARPMKIDSFQTEKGSSDTGTERKPGLRGKKAEKSNVLPVISRRFFIVDRYFPDAVTNVQRLSSYSAHLLRIKAADTAQEPRSGISHPDIQGRMKTGCGLKKFNIDSVWADYL